MSKFRFAVRPLALAAATLAALLAVTSAQAVITASGATNVYPGNAPIGPGDTDLGNVGLFVGNGGPGSLLVDSGSLLRTGSLMAGPSGAGNGDGTVLITGAGTLVELTGDGFSDGVINRFGAGEWGRGSVTVAGGALLDGRTNAAACVGQFHYCNNFIGNAAGSDGTLTVTGTGSQARFLRFFGVGGVAVFHPPIDAFTFGTPGASTTGRVNVLAGGTLVSDNANLGLAPGGGSPTGRERSFAEATIDGASSVWRVTGPSIGGDTGTPNFNTASHRNAWASVNITNGGSLRMEGSGNAYSAIGLTTGGGRTDMLVSGSGSNITFASQSGVLQIGRVLGSATLDVRAGALVDNVWYTSVGRDGSFGTLNIDGTGTLYRANGTATAAANTTSGVAAFDIGRGGGTGTVNVTNGARLEMTATAATTGAPHFSLGRDDASAGTLNIGGGGVVQISAASVAPGTAGEAWNPFVRVGRDGSGTLAITGGGKLLVQGNAVSTVDFTRRTSVFIGGSGDATDGGRGIATVTGAGSELRVSGADAYIGVGHGPQAVGTMTIANQGLAAATIMGVGNFGGTGVLKLDNATVDVTGQYTGSGQFGAALVIGSGAGAVGNVNLVNGSTVRITNTSAVGNTGGGLTIGGSLTQTGGDGSLSLSASSVIFDMPNNNAGFSVGRSGSGLLRMSNGSALELGGNTLYVGRLPGSDGTLIATGGSTIEAGWVGIGRQRSGGVDTDGGTATMVLNGATLNATDIVIGTNGFLGGSTGAIVASGTITNYGIFSPGSSPGTFTIDGDYVAGAGSRLILEVQGSAGGGFATDLVYFKQGNVLDLAALNVEFRFLGGTNPEEFKQSGGFDIDTFLAVQTAGGQTVQIDHALLANTSYSARADAYTFTSFDFSADGGASFVAVPVPEPGAWALMLAGCGLLAGLARRRRTAGR